MISVLVLKILVFLIPVIIGVSEKKKLSRGYLGAIILFSGLGIANEWHEYTSKKKADEQNSQLSKTIYNDSNKIGSLLKYDTAITQSNSSLKDSANSLLRLNYRIKSKLDAIELALSKNQSYYNAKTQEIEPLPTNNRTYLENISKQEGKENSIADDQRKQNLALWLGKLKSANQSYGTDKEKTRDLRKSISSKSRWNNSRYDDMNELTRVGSQMQKDSIRIINYSDSVKKYQK